MRRGWAPIPILIVSIAAATHCRAQATAQKKEAVKPAAVSKTLHLEISLSGLIALVREGCAADPTKPQALHTVLMKGEMPDKTTHQPRLVVESIYAGPENSPSEIIEVEDGKQYLVWDMTGYRLELDQTPPRIGINEDKQKKHGKTPVPGDTDDFFWVPELHLACGAAPEKLRIKTEAFDKEKMTDFAIARLMDLQIVKAASPYGVNMLRAVNDPKWKNIPYDFPGKNYTQSLADRVSLTMDLKYVDHLTLKLVPLDGSGKKEQPPIQVRPTPAGKSVFVSVTNFPPKQEPYKNTVDHFHHYSDLAYDPTTNCVIPVKSGSGAAPVKCTVCGTCGPHP